MRIEIREHSHPMSPMETDAIRRTIASALRHHACERVRIRLVRRDGTQAGRRAWECHVEIASGRPDEGLFHAMGLGYSRSAAVHDACAGAERALVAARYLATGTESAAFQAA
jgi:hypothetical protein